MGVPNASPSHRDLEPGLAAMRRTGTSFLPHSQPPGYRKSHSSSANRVAKVVWEVIKLKCEAFHNPPFVKDDLPDEKARHEESNKMEPASWLRSSLCFLRADMACSARLLHGRRPHSLPDLLCLQLSLHSLSHS
ncbi:hypothetical protein EJ04DRAFT_51102 [Polyplosphaeria fusca]|uniref:Uncharacterized protein n=1 Tax=Polyplosphaeria fusca TaxID=682080 RepID=A0A9P4R8F9_9PLEO|nr:hypothetical protein EJ04DRAFT_51102 [Polyplosphaeria fusca]